MQRLLLFAAIFPVLYFGRSAFAVSGPGDVVGKVTVGYQGWFACAGDGSPMNNWWHWSHKRFGTGLHRGLCAR